MEKVENINAARVRWCCDDRTISNQKPELTGKVKEIIERTERQRETYLGLLEELNDSPEPFIPADVKWAHPGAAAAWARERLELTEHNTFSTYREALEALGVLVFRSNGYAGDWQIPKQSKVVGFSLYHEVCPVIFVRKQPFETRQTFTLFHELGHLLLHRDSFIDDEGDLLSHARKEVEANAFAGLVLVPDFLLARIPLATKPTQADAFNAWLEEYRKAWGVSTEVILRRLADSEMIPQRDYEAYRRFNSGRGIPTKLPERGSREWRYREPVHLFGTNFVKTVFDALNTQHIPLTRATRYLDGLKVKDLHQLEEHYNQNGVGENDLLIIAHAMIERMPLVTNEAVQNKLPTNRQKFRIPAVCDLPEVRVRHLNFVGVIKESRQVF